MGPRLFGIPALEAPVVAVLRRGPSSWSAVGRWDVDAMTYEQGAWLRGTLYPQRCDVSPDGKLLAYFTLKGSARWGPGATYVAVSKLPWLTALAAWGTGGTWTRGIHFDSDPANWRVDEPDEGTLEPIRGRLGLAVTASASYAVERRRGWTEAAGTPPRGDKDLWDEKRAVTLRLEKPRPGDDRTRLEVTGEYAAFRAMHPKRGAAAYRMLAGGAATPLRGVQWADWAGDGTLLVATAAGELQQRNAADWTASAVVVADLSLLGPDPAPAPPAAARW
jgi:hypothetical protein